jgi:4-hydroxybenzoate polyprenyltransferase
MANLKKILKLIFNEFIYGGHLISLVAPAFIFIGATLLEKDVDLKLLIISYLIALIIYRYNYYSEFAEDVLTNPDRSQYLKNKIKYYIFSIIICFLILIIFLIKYTDQRTILFSIFLSVGGIFYTRWFKKLTKKIIGFKNFYIAIFWTFLTLLTCFYYSVFTWSFLILSIFVFLKSFINTIFFDIKDIEADKKENLKTIPVIFGKGGTLNFLQILNILSFLPLTIGLALNILPKFILVLFVFYFYEFYYLERSRNKNANIQKISYIIADGEFLLWPIGLIIGKLCL